MKNDLVGFEKVCRVDELQEKIGKRFLVNDIDVAVFKSEGKVYALCNICPHQHASIMYEGFVENDFVICPAHGWEFNLQTGKMHTGGSGLDTYEVKIVDDDVFIKAYEKKTNWNF